MNVNRQEREEQQSLPAAQTRVKSDELAKAIAAIEARRLDDMVVLGDALQELQLDVTPEEVQAEVQAQRERDQAQKEAQFQAQASNQQAQRNFRQGIKIGGSILGAFLFLWWLMSFGSPGPVVPPVIVSPLIEPPPIQPPRTVLNRWWERVGPLDAAFYHKLAQCWGPNPQYRIHLQSVQELAFGTATDPVYPINAVPDGRPFYGARILGETNGLVVFSFQPVGGAHAPNVQEWTFVRYVGRFYRRGWIRQEDKERVMRGQLTSYYPAPALPGAFLPLTLPENGRLAETCTTVPGSQSFVPAAEGEVRLDAHAWEPELHPSPVRVRPPRWALAQIGVLNNDFYLAGFDTDSVLKPLRLIPDGQVVRCSGQTMLQMLQAYPYTKPAGQVVIDARGGLPHPWQVVKFDGHPYLRGWIAARISQQELNERPILIYSDNTASAFITPPVPITVPLEGATWNSIRGGSLPETSSAAQAPFMTASITLSKIVLDQHAWEKWSPE